MPHPVEPPLPPDPPGAATAIELNEGLDGVTLNISGAPERSAAPQNVSVWYSGGTYFVEDPGGVGVREGCTLESAIRARCPSRFLGHGITAQLGGGDDTLRLLGGIPLVASGGLGRDRIYSGNADDILQGSLGRDVIDAGITPFSLDDSFGVAAQLGADWVFSGQWLVNFDIRWINIEADLEATVDDGTGPVTADLGTVEIDPWVFAVNIGYRF